MKETFHSYYYFLCDSDIASVCVCEAPHDDKDGEIIKDITRCLMCDSVLERTESAVNIFLQIAWWETLACGYILFTHWIHLHRMESN